MSVDSGKHKAECRVAETPQELTLAFTPEKTGTVDFSVVPDWAGVGRVASLTLKGAAWSGKVPEVPSDVVFGGKVVRGTLEVTAGISVEVRAVVTPRDEWPR